MNNRKIFLNKRKNKLSSNKNSFICTAIHSDSRALPIDDASYVLDEYQQYLKEKSSSNIYRLSFIINPICSNVLFNHLTEIVYKEGSDDCIVFNEYDNEKNVSGITNVEKYLDYKSLTNITSYDITKKDLIRDTAFSHKDIGGFVYHCGYDIFNNHTLRKKEFNVVNKLVKDTDLEGYDYQYFFNTIFDYMRHHDGGFVKEDKIKWSKDSYNDNKQNVHLYTIDTINSFEDTINEKLVEVDGWVGFINPTTLDIANYGDISLNKCMNNNKPCEFIDMYPDRSLYSFMPKINKYRNNRAENNWDYCLTYPSEKYFDNDIVSYKNGIINVNGIRAIAIDLVKAKDENGDTIDFYDDEDNSIITLKTDIKHNLTSGSTIKITAIIDNGEKKESIELDEYINVNKVYFDTDINSYCIVINGNEVIDLYNKYNVLELRIQQVINGAPCEYYFRKFKKIPFKNNSLSPNSNGINSTLSKMGFSRNIYKDTIVQLLFNDNVDISGLKDNLGRKISEIFLTIVKNNKGYNEWYIDGKCTSSSVTFSHCFGEVTSGIDMKNSEVYDYNVHKLHNINTGITNAYKLSKGNNSNNETGDNVFEHLFVKYGEQYRIPKTLESGIDISKDDFLGDIVEFSPYTIEETVLENVYHRFNTYQREYWGEGNYAFLDLIRDEIEYDDYDIGTNRGFTVKEKNFNCFYDEGENKKNKIPANIDPEGYYYKPHYGIKLRKYHDEVKQGRHQKIVFTDGGKSDDGKWKFTTSINYYLEPNKELYLYEIETGRREIATITNVSNLKNITIMGSSISSIDDINNYYIFKPNSEMPEYAYDLKDSFGRYLWRDEVIDMEDDEGNSIDPQVFTNGAHYINKNINFFLMRQDPTGFYNLSNVSNTHPILQNMSIQGDKNDYSIVEIIDETIEGIC